ncbi:protein translocase subunit SecD [Rhodohalobacter barkolensis]|uniref:Protein translocase subunit SecD n=1 Tax=Rhodohalobacter barkolensis TaxID=2053187 RepID=A0A2N0VFS4_9BACT|nr:protein translocase subunit SecD [Rhodohalobacter barkolensis]PKD43029.1 protein translocase subunit SecD [Rhodohalobacter barkolensis]
MKSQNNGFKIGSIVVFLGLTLWYLFPTLQWNLEQRHMADMTDSERVQYRAENLEKLNSLQEKSLSLGLDLQGGMYVTLEIGTSQLVLELAGDYADDYLEEVISVSAERAMEQRTDFIDEFVNEFESRDPDAMLSRYYRSDADEITRRSSNEEITTFLKTQRDEAVTRAMEIIRSRVDRFGVTEPGILQQGNNRIVVELPGVDDEERVRDLLRGTARLEFRMVAEPDEINAAKQQVVDYFQNNQEELEEVGEENLLEVFDPNGRNQYVFGYAAGPDTSVVNTLLQKEDVQRLIPRNTTLMWGAQPFATDGGLELFELIAVRSQIELTGDVIDEARVAFDPTTNASEVSMTMDSEGARRWARITGANIGRPVAIALDGYVVSYPTVQNAINNGRSSITGIGNVQDAEDLVNILLSGALPAPLDIVEERTVGASLGEASISAGLYSTLFGLMVVALFMIVYYRTGGAIADIALILNIIFILGILAAFQATLTLPGMAGIVLTIGMAVDANVLIFDRIREEMRGGKTLRAAIDNGYSNAMSAIIDANVTTFFVAIILYSFGVGPIKGFAVTLMAGIVASLFSAIVITRVIVDYLTREKTANVNFG